MNSQWAIAILLLAALALASWPFLFKRFALFGPLKAAHPWLLVLESLLAYAAFVLLGRALEQSLGQVTPQAWQFYAVTFCLFCTLSFPGFVYRYLLK